MRRLLTNITLLTFILSSFHQVDIKVANIQNGIVINSENINVMVQFYTENIVRITKWIKDGTEEKKRLSVIQHSVPLLNISREETEKQILLSSAKLSLPINKKIGNVEYLTNEKETCHPVFEPVAFNGNSGFAVWQSFRLTPNEGIYGLGQQKNNYFNYSEKETRLAQNNTEAMNPFLVSTQNYGLFWDNYSMVIFKDDKNGTSIWSDMGDNIDYYFIKGSTMDNVISGYRYLTGTTPMYGKFAYVHWQSKEHYNTQQELFSVARKYRKMKIPIDNMIQDWDYRNGNPDWESKV